MLWVYLRVVEDDKKRICPVVIATIVWSFSLWLNWFPSHVGIVFSPCKYLVLEGFRDSLSINIEAGEFIFIIELFSLVLTDDICRQKDIIIPSSHDVRIAAYWPWNRFPWKFFGGARRKEILVRAVTASANQFFSRGMIPYLLDTCTASIEIGS